MERVNEKQECTSTGFRQHHQVETLNIVYVFGLQTSDGEREKGKGCRLVG